MAERYLIKDGGALPDISVLSESQRKKVERDERLEKEAKEAISALVSKRKERRAELLERTLAYEKEYEAEEKELIKARREATEQCGFYKTAEPKVLFAIRLKGINKLAPKPKKILQLFRLRQIHNAVFIKVNKATKEMLKCIQPFITYGYPTVSTIRKLIYKRGYAKIGKLGAWSRKRILNNDIISANLGQYGLHGVEDLVHEIHTCGPHFKEVNNFLWPFKLTNPRGGWVAKRRGFCDPRGGDWGNREHLINKLVKRMN